MSRLRGGERDLTLVEISVALVVLTVFVAGVFGTLNTAQRAEGFARAHQAASEAATLTLDELAALPLEALLQNGLQDVPEHCLRRPLPGGDLPAARRRGVRSAQPGAGRGDAGPRSGAGARRRGRSCIALGRGPLDYDGDGLPDYVEIRVFVAWKDLSAGGAPARVDLVTRRVR